MARMCILPLCWAVLLVACRVEGHGRMIMPASRASAWRLGLTGGLPRNYNDNEAYCGGQDVQWNQNNGNCGICGDNYAGPREHERPNGRFVIPGNDFVLSSFTQGGEISVKIEITAWHLGHFEFHVCSVDALKAQDISAMDATHQCLYNTPLLVKETNKLYYGRPFNDTHQNSDPEIRLNTWYNMTVILPATLTCQHCVLQWKYLTANSPTLFFSGAVEQFYSCADISIVQSSEQPVTAQPPVTDIPFFVPDKLFKPNMTSIEKDHLVNFFLCDYCMFENPQDAACADFSPRACRRSG